MDYQYDAGIILTTPLKNRTGTYILYGITNIHKQLRKQGLTSKPHIMDNEASEGPKQYFEDSKIQFQFVSPRMHQRNAAERAVRTFKNHFIADLCNVDHLFLFYL